jgi:hypothetical protein
VTSVHHSNSENEGRRHWDLCHDIVEIAYYLRATDIEVAPLLNFGPKAAFKRLVFDNGRKASRVQTRSATTS